MVIRLHSLVDELLQDFARDARRWQPILASRYAKVFSRWVLEQGCQAFAALNPHIPHIGGEQNHLSGALYGAARKLALYQAMKGQAISAAETGEVLYDSVLTMLS
jgi:hypothetical protein